jgi:hypothetical protein
MEIRYEILESSLFGTRFSQLRTHPLQSHRDSAGIDLRPLKQSEFEFCLNVTVSRKIGLVH